jgi:hypothetical protein
MSKTPVVLTEALVLSKSKTASLADVRSLTLWGFRLCDISIVSRMTNAETLALSVNEIRTLEPFSHCPKLHELFLRKNHIAELSELDHLRGLSELRVLWLSDNPITDQPGYRDYTIARLPQLTKLDEIDITPDDREAAMDKFPATEPQRKQDGIVTAIRLLLRNLDADGIDAVFDEIELLRRKQ